MVDAEVWAALGAALRREAGAGGGPLMELVGGRPRPAERVRDGLGEAVFGTLLREGVLELRRRRHRRRVPAPDALCSRARGRRTGADARPDMVYIGPDSGLLVEAALRLAPSGERAVDLGTGTGFLAAALSRRYRCVVATDIVRRAAEAARCTMMLNDRPPGHVWLTVQTRRHVRAADSLLRPRRGEHAVGPGERRCQYPRQHLRQRRARRARTAGAVPRRRRRTAPPGGVAVLLALHVERADGGRPLLELCATLERDGYSVAVIPTALNRSFPELSTKTLARCPDLVEAIHVAVVIGAPPAEGGRRDSLLVACDGLARRWQTETLSLGVMA